MLPSFASKVEGLLASGRLMRAFATVAEELPRPSYIYHSPGSSMSEPRLGTGHSLGSPVYEIDRKPERSAGRKSEPTAEEEAGYLNATRAALRVPKATEAVSKATRASNSPSYVYSAPGGSLREASYGFSISDPVYHVDPKPAAPQVLGAKKHAKASSEPHTLQPVAPAPSSNKVRIGLQPDEYASQSYTVSPKGSMREPRYVSVSDPDPLKK